MLLRSLGPSFTLNRGFRGWVWMPQKIFICYRRDDSGMAGRIGDSLGIEFGRDGVFLRKGQSRVRYRPYLFRELHYSSRCCWLGFAAR